MAMNLSAADKCLGHMRNEINDCWIRFYPEFNMPDTDFFIFNNIDGDIIGFWDHQLRIRVVDIIDEPYQTDPNELHFYGDNRNIPIVFETIDYEGENISIIIEAIKWYAEYINYPQMKITRENRFPPVN